MIFYFQLSGSEKQLRVKNNQLLKAMHIIWFFTLIFLSQRLLIKKNLRADVLSLWGNFFHFDGEVFVRKGVGRVRIEPEPGKSNQTTPQN